MLLNALDTCSRRLDGNGHLASGNKASNGQLDDGEENTYSMLPIELCLHHLLFMAGAKPEGDSSAPQILVRVVIEQV